MANCGAWLNWLFRHAMFVQPEVRSAIARIQLEQSVAKHSVDMFLQRMRIGHER